MKPQLQRSSRFWIQSARFFRLRARLCNRKPAPRRVFRRAFFSSPASNSGGEHETRQFANKIVDHKRRKERKQALEEPKTRQFFANKIVEYRKRKDWKQVLGLHRQMKQRGVTPDLITFNALIDAYGHVGKAKQSIQLLSDMRTAKPAVWPNVHSYTGAIKACVKQKEELQLNSLWQQMLADGVAPNRHTYSVMLGFFAKARQPRRAFQVFQEMEEKGLVDAFAYASLITAYGNARGGAQWKQALAKLREMQGKGIALNTVVYTAAITACAKANGAGQWNEARGLFEEMKRKGLKPNQVTYCAVINAHEKVAAGPTFDAILALLREMEEEHGIKPNVITYNSALNVCANMPGMQWVQATEVLRDMRAKGTRPDLITYNSMLACCSKAGKLEEAVAFLGEAKRKGFAPDQITYKHVLATFEAVHKTGKIMGTASPGGLWEKALAILQEMTEAGGSAPTTVHYSHVLGLLVRAPHHSVSTPQPQPAQAAAGARREEGARQERELLLMKQLLAAMKRGGVQLDVYAFNLCIRVYGQAGDWRGALDVLADMSRSGVKEDMFTFNWVLVALATAPGGGRWKHALILLDRMQEMAVVPNVDTYGAAIACCERAAGGAQLGRVLALFGQMAERGLEPDLSCYNAALRACIGPEGEAAGQWKVAMKLLSDMTRKGVHPNKESLDAAVTACEVSDQPEMAEVLKKAVCKLKAARQESSLQTLFQGW